MSASADNWGELIEKTLNFGREDRSSKFKKIESNDSRYETFTHCSHAMIYAKTNSEFETFPKKAVVLMQMRCDGYIGFPGGIVEKGEAPIDGLFRELKEELGWVEGKQIVANAHLQFSHVDEDKETVFHFYSIEVTEKEMEKIECNMLKASDYGGEVLGNFRVPLYIMGDAFRGFPAFLRNHFIGNAKLQLIQTLINLKFFTEEQVVQSLYSAPMITY